MSDFPAPLPDQLLVQMVQGGDREAFELLVIRYQRRIFRLISRLVRDPSLAEDVAQEAFLRAYRSIGSFRGDSQFYTWLYRIAVNTAKRAMLHSGRESGHCAALAGGAADELGETGSDLDTPEALLSGREVLLSVNAALEALPEGLRTAIALREIDGMSYEDIARIMNCPVGTVRSRIYRAREAIAREVGPLLGRVPSDRE